MRPGSRVGLIANPASGRGRAGRILDQAREELMRRGHVPLPLPTAQAGHAVELARRGAEDGLDLLLSIGGDGTLRDVAEGLRETPRPPPVGVLPLGTGNDFARHLGIPTDPAAALAIALGNKETAVDVWELNGRTFINVAGIGLDAAVAADVNAHRGAGPVGTATYVASFLRVFRRHAPAPLTLSWPGGEWAGAAWLVAFGNASSYGGGMRIAPDAVVDDGLLDLVIVESMPKPALLVRFPQIFAGTHVRDPRVRVERVSEVSVTSNLPARATPITLDGELIGDLPARVVRSARPLVVRTP